MNFLLKPSCRIRDISLTHIKRHKTETGTKSTPGGVMSERRNKRKLVIKILIQAKGLFLKEMISTGSKIMIPMIISILTVIKTV